MFPECERSFLNPCPGAKHSQPRPPHRCRRLDSSRCAGEGRTAAKWQQCQDLGQEQGSGPAGSHPQAGAYSHPPNPRPAQLSPSGVSPPCVPQAVSGDLPSRFSGTLGAHEEDTNAPRQALHRKTAQRPLNPTTGRAGQRCGGNQSSAAPQPWRGGEAGLRLPFVTQVAAQARGSWLCMRARTLGPVSRLVPPSFPPQWPQSLG